MRKLLILLFLSIPAWGQITDYNVPRSGIGLTVCIGPGANNLSGSPVSYAGSCLTMTTQTTNFGYLDHGTGNLLVNTTGAPTGSCPVFEADTDAFMVTKVRDKRIDGCGGGGANNPGGANTQIQFNNSSVFGGSPRLTWDGQTFVVNSTISTNSLFNPGFFQANFTGTNDTQQVAAISATGNNGGTGTAARIVGVSANVSNSGPGTITEADDFVAGANGALGGTVPLFVGLRVQNHNGVGATSAFGAVFDSGTNSIALGGTSGPTLSSGAGAPTGVLTAPVGSLYYQTDGTPGNALYVKTSATDNSGWDPVPSNLSPLPTPEGYLSWTPGTLYPQTLTGTCVFSGGTTCTVSYPTTFASAPLVQITPINPGAVTFTVTTASTSQLIITGSAGNTVTVDYAATLPAAINYTTNTLTVPGLRKDVDFLAVVCPSNLPADVVCTARVSTSDTAEIRLFNPTSNTVTFGSAMIFGVKAVR